MKINKILNLLCLAFLLSFFSSDATGKISKQKSNDSETILERLEKKLKDQQEDVLDLDSVRKLPSKSDDKTTKYEFKEGLTITSKSGMSPQMNELDKAIHELESEVEQLSSEVQKLKQDVFVNAKIDNVVEIKTKLPISFEMSFRTINAKLDGYLVYDAGESTDLWTPRNEVPLFSGPLQPGKHVIDFEARLVRRKLEGLPVTENIYAMVRNRFEFNVPIAKEKRAITILLSKPEKNGSNVIAKLESISAN
ncbi:MAG: hypothetical protein HQK54_00910 [Oligoflexales bacterium]|nr:hypothetical protein [Oligoflexales bacterium]